MDIRPLVKNILLPASFSYFTKVEVLEILDTYVQCSTFYAQTYECHDFYKCISSCSI